MLRAFTGRGASTVGGRRTRVNGRAHPPRARPNILVDKSDEGKGDWISSRPILSSATPNPDDTGSA
jgi:hypothetical protein